MATILLEPWLKTKLRRTNTDYLRVLLCRIFVTGMVTAALLPVFPADAQTEATAPPALVDALVTLVTLADKPGPQTIKGWGCFLGDYANLDASQPSSPVAEEIFSLGITTVRLSVPTDCYLSGTGDTVDSIRLDQSKLIVKLIPRIKLAKSHGVDYFLSTWSPPAAWKLPDHTDRGGTKTNGNYVHQYLDPTKVQAYCNYYVKVLKTIQSLGGGLPTHISVQNEPNYPVVEYAGSSYQPLASSGVDGPGLWRTVVKTMRKTLDANGLSSVKIHGTDDQALFRRSPLNSFSAMTALRRSTAIKSCWTPLGPMPFMLTMLFLTSRGFGQAWSATRRIAGWRNGAAKRTESGRRRSARSSISPEISRASPTAIG